MRGMMSVLHGGVSIGTENVPVIGIENVPVLRLLRSLRGAAAEPRAQSS